MSIPTSELVAIARLNGDFQKNFGKLIGAYLYLRSVSAARSRPAFWTGFLFAALSALTAAVEGCVAVWLHRLAASVG